MLYALDDLLLVILPTDEIHGRVARTDYHHVALGAATHGDGPRTTQVPVGRRVSICRPLLAVELLLLATELIIVSRSAFTDSAAQWLSVGGALEER